MKWLAVGKEIWIYARDDKLVGEFRKDDFPDMILAMCKVLKEVK